MASFSVKLLSFMVPSKSVRWGGEGEAAEITNEQIKVFSNTKNMRFFEKAFGRKIVRGPPSSTRGMESHPKNIPFSEYA